MMTSGLNGLACWRDHVALSKITHAANGAGLTTDSAPGVPTGYFIYDIASVHYL